MLWDIRDGGAHYVAGVRARVQNEISSLMGVVFWLSASALLTDLSRYVTARWMDALCASRLQSSN